MIAVVEKRDRAGLAQAAREFSDRSMTTSWRGKMREDEILPNEVRERWQAGEF